MDHAKFVAEKVAHDAYMCYHRERLQLSEGLETIDQSRKYTVLDRGGEYVVEYRDGFNSGMPKIYATVNKKTYEITTR